MPIQRQSEQYGAFESGPRWERDRGQHDLPKGLAGLVNSMGPRISSGMLNTRTAANEEEMAELDREHREREFPRGDYTGADYPADDDHDGSAWPGKRGSRLAVNTDGMDPREHAYGRQEHDPLFGEFGHDGYDYEGVSPGQYRQMTRGYDPDVASQMAREEEDDESGYNWGPVPPEHLGAVSEDYSGGDEDDPDWIREHSPRQQETNRKRGDEISRSKEMFARRGSGRHPFDHAAERLAAGLIDLPGYAQDPDDLFNTKARRGTCTMCGAPRSEPSGPDCAHGDYRGPRYQGEPREDYEEFYRRHSGLFGGGAPHDHDVSWEQTDEGWSHPVTKAKVNESQKHPGEWEIHLPTTSKRRPYTSVGHHPDPQKLMQDHDRRTGFGPALPPHTGAAEVMAPAQAPMGGGYQIGHRVGLPWRESVIPGTVIGLDGPSTQIRWDDGQYSTEEPHNIQLL